MPESLFLIKLQAHACNFIKKETWHRCFPVNFAKFLRTPFFYKTPLAAASEVKLYNLKKKPQQNRVYNLELRNSSFNLFLCILKS